MKYFISSLISILITIPSFSCTSVIISGRVRADGRPVMMKHRDTDCLDNKLEWFEGEKYSFVALVNSDWKTNPTCKYSVSGEAWTGVNTAGFSIMNTATYDLKNDDVPADEMDCEGVLMHRALSICRSVEDFETLLDTLPRPLRVEANFGVIDAYGGAAYYEVNNDSWVKFDVNEEKCGYRVVTNFTQTGRPADRKGVDRYQKARTILSSSDNPSSWDHEFLLNSISRSGSPILRNITSASIVIEGVRSGESPEGTVMWTALGWPATTVSVPVLALGRQHVPSYLVSENGTALMCDNALKIKEAGLVPPSAEVESWINDRFFGLYKDWREGRISSSRFIMKYDKLCLKYYKVYKKNFLQFIEF